jgi:hypothetical protein
MILLQHMLTGSLQRSEDASEISALPGLLPGLAAILGAASGSDQVLCLEIWA